MKSLFTRNAEETPVQPAPLSALARAERACCCSARPMVTVLVPRSASRSDFTELLLCRHHFHASEATLRAIGATAYDEDDQLIL